MRKYIDKFQFLEKGQKIKLIIVIVLVIVVLYMLRGMFSSNGSSYTPAANNQGATPTQIQLHADVTPKRAIPKPAMVVDDLNDKQTAYLKAVNELQMLQLKQQIAQTKQQIAQAELQAAESNKKLQAITAPPPPTPAFTAIEQEQQAPTAVTPTTADDYQLQYIANQGGKWQVIISDNSKLINATLGTTLPDGSQITNISGTSVTLSLNGQQKILTIEASY